jgi:putative ABC transport system substrate-binding protein
VAARSARAAVGENADHRVPGREHVCGLEPLGRCFCAAARRTRLDGRTVAIEYRWAEGRGERYTPIAAEFARLKVDVIVTVGSAVVAAKQATSVIPIVFATAVDPIGTGLVASLARPGGNVTGLSVQSIDIAGKRLELLREVVPQLRRLAIIGNVGFPQAVLELGEVEAVAHTLGIEVAPLEIRRAEDIAPAFAALRSGAQALYVCADALITAYRVRIITLALGARLPAIYPDRSFLEAGGLMSYGADIADLFRRAPILSTRFCAERSRLTFRSSSRPSSISSSI